MMERVIRVAGEGEVAQGSHASNRRWISGAAKSFASVLSVLKLRWMMIMLWEDNMTD